MIESQQLLIRRFKASDWQDLHEYMSKASVVEYEPYEAFDEETSKKVAKLRSEDHAFYAVILKESQTLIGHIYFTLCEPSHKKTYVIGYVFNPNYGGKGYATEACKKIIEYGFEELDAHRIMARCNPENRKSWRLLERLHMRREGHFIKCNYFNVDENKEPIWHDAYEYAILSEEWLSLKESNIFDDLEVLNT